MSKRAKVRDWLLEQENGITFSIWEVATKCGVTPKDVSNMVSVLYKASALTEGMIMHVSVMFMISLTGKNLEMH